MAYFSDQELLTDVNARMKAFMDTYSQLQKAVRRAHFNGTATVQGNADYTRVRDFVVDFEALMCNNGAPSARTPAQRAALVELFGVVDTL